MHKSMRVSMYTEIYMHACMATTGRISTPKQPAFMPAGRHCMVYAGHLPGFGDADGSKAQDGRAMVLDERDQPFPQELRPSLP